MYIVKFHDGNTIEVNQQEHEAILKAISKQDKMILLTRLSQSIASSAISRIIPTSDYLEEEKSRDYDGKVGVLHDGIQVIRYFGSWVKPDSAHENSNGDIVYEKCSWDYSYYPEIAVDDVKTPGQFQEWLLVKNEVPYLTNAKDHPKLRENRGFTKLLE